MLNSEKFLSIFETVEKALKKMVSPKTHIPFYSLVDQATRLNKAVGRFEKTLKEYADLRNAIIHERTDSHVIAEPNDQAVADFGNIKEVLLNPPKVIPQFQAQVTSCEITEAIAKAVSLMNKKSFSQIPITAEEKTVALLTAETVARWLASETLNELVSLLDTKIGDVLKHTENTNNYLFLSRNATLFDVLAKFEYFSANGLKLDAILLSQDGRPGQAILGIITVSDFPKILEKLKLKQIYITP
jgi:predicted transcriptional regulator